MITSRKISPFTVLVSLMSVYVCMAYNSCTTQLFDDNLSDLGSDILIINNSNCVLKISMHQDGTEMICKD